MRNTIRLLIATAAALALALPLSLAAKDTPPPLADMWILVPKAGHGEAF